MHRRVSVLPDADFNRLREIRNSGTLDGEADTTRIIKYLASALIVVAEGQKDIAEALKDSAAKEPGR